MPNGIKKILESHLEDVDFSKKVTVEDMLVAAVLELMEKKGIDWKIWGMFSIPLIVIILDKVL